MCSFSHEATSIEHEDPVHVSDGGKMVGHKDQKSFLAPFRKAFFQSDGGLRV